MSYSLFMKKLATKWFKKWSKKVNLSSQTLMEAIENLEHGLSTADLGAHLHKVRVKRSSKGKRSGFRTVVVYRKEDRAIFLYGFSKNEKANIDASELAYFKKLGRDLLSLDADQLNQYIEQQILFDLGVK
jgi:hypothetical protein